MSENQLHRLADCAPVALGPELGPVWRTGILFTAYVGPRLESFCAGEFNCPYTAVLLPHVVDELCSLLRRTDIPNVFWSRGALTKGSAFYGGTRCVTPPGCRT